MSFEGGSQRGRVSSAAASDPLFDGLSVGFRCAPSGYIGAHRIAHPMNLGAWWAPMVPVGRFQRKLTMEEAANRAADAIDEDDCESNEGDDENEVDGDGAGWVGGMQQSTT